jgi:hypothetical protein
MSTVRACGSPQCGMSICVVARSLRTFVTLCGRAGAPQTNQRSDPGELDLVLDLSATRCASATTRSSGQNGSGHRSQGSHWPGAEGLRRRHRLGGDGQRR